MLPAPRRRDVLQWLRPAPPVSRCLAPCAPAKALAAGDSVPPSRITRRSRPSRLSDSVLLVSGAGGNVVVVTGPDGRVIVNGGAQERSADLLKLIAAQAGGARVATLFNTDWHPRAHRLERDARQGRREDHRAREHQAVPGRRSTSTGRSAPTKPLPPQALPNQTFLHDRAR